MNWGKTIYCSKNEIFLEKLNKISEILINGNWISNPIDLLSGKSGSALFFSYYWLLKKKKIYLDMGSKLLGHNIEAINNGFGYDTYAGGIAGIAWTFQHLYKNSFINEDPNELFGELDSYFGNRMISYINKGNYDYLHGGLGIALYLIERNNPKTRESLSKFLKILEEKGAGDGDGIKWVSLVNKKEKIKGYNLSLSHGIASIIIILSYLYKNGVEKEKTLNLINRAVKYLLNQKKNVDSLSLFPSLISKVKPSDESRLAWCYGDLGIGIALFQAAVIIGDENLKKESLVILKHTTKRRDLEQNRVIDAGLCHGAAGIAHIYNRMFNYTGDEEFKDSALYWIEQTLKMDVFDDGLAGYKAWKTKNYGGWVNEAGLLEGIAGIGLMLISAISDIEPSWDRCLLLS